jgi:ATP-dependent Lon protease
MSQQLDHVDTIAAKAFEGYVVRKDLVRKFKGQYPVPTYVAEFLLGRYCASVDDEEIAEGLKIVERQLGEKTIRAGEHELFKARAKEKGQVKLIDIVTARLDAATDSFLATLPSLQLKDVRISEEMVHANERMLTGGFYAEVELAYDPTIAQERNGRPFGIDSLREIQLSKRDVLPALYQGREAFATEEWKDFLILSIGMEPEKLTPRDRDMMLLRMVPFVERNYNMVELGPRGTGKSHLFQPNQIDFQGAAPPQPYRTYAGSIKAPGGIPQNSSAVADSVTRPREPRSAIDGVFLDASAFLVTNPRN